MGGKERPCQAPPDSSLLGRSLLSSHSPKVSPARTHCAEPTQRVLGILHANGQLVVFQCNVSWLSSCSRGSYVVFKMVLRVQVIGEGRLLVKVETVEQHGVGRGGLSLSFPHTCQSPPTRPQRSPLPLFRICFAIFSPMCVYTLVGR